MTTEELQAEVDRLRAELAEEREERKRMGRALEDAMAAVRAAADDRKALEARRAADRERKNASRARRLADVAASRDRCDAVSRDRHVTAPPSSSSPFPSSFPPSPIPSSPYPLSFPPSSPPSLVPPASQEAPEQHPLLPTAAPGLARKAKEAKKPREPTGDPRHAPLVKALTDAGYPFRGGRDAKAVSELLALADQQEVTRGEAAGVEILRRARIGWAWEGYPTCRSLTELHTNWGHYEAPQPPRSGAGPAPPSKFEEAPVFPKFPWLDQDYSKPEGSEEKT